MRNAVPPDLENHLRTLEESHLRPEVLSDPDSLRALLAEDFVEIGSSGSVVNRAAVLQVVPGQPAFHWRIDDFHVRVLSPAVALTTYRLSAWSASETERSVTLRSSVWVQRERAWVLAFHQGTRARG